MNLHPGPLIPHGDGFFTWHAYDPACKAELWSTLFRGPRETVLFDPINWPEASPWPDAPVWIVRTNGNHDRDFEALRARNGTHLTRSLVGFTPIPLPGGGEDETAYFHDATGTLVVGDALIHLAPHGLMPLPDKYCTDPGLLKKSLAALTRYPVRRIFFAHGDPILQSGSERIRNLLV